MSKVLTDLALWAVGGLASLLTPIGAVIKRNRSRSLQNKRQLQGDPDDPNSEGVLDIAHDTRRELRDLRKDTKRDHREVMSRIDTLAEQINGDDLTDEYPDD